MAQDSSSKYRFRSRLDSSSTLRINGEVMIQIQELQVLVETGLTPVYNAALPADSDEQWNSM